MFFARPVVLNEPLFGIEVVLDAHHFPVLYKTHRKHPVEEIDSRLLLFPAFFLELLNNLHHEKDLVVCHFQYL